MDEYSHEVIGYKAFKITGPNTVGQPLYTINGRPILYYSGKVYETSAPKIGESGFHYCDTPYRCFNYYKINPDTVIYCIKILGDVKTKYELGCTDKMQILHRVQGKFEFDTYSPMEPEIRYSHYATFVNGQLNSIDDGPAYVNSRYAKWYENNLVHRDRGPAIMGGNGLREWWQDGKMHNDDDMPAYILPYVLPASKDLDWWDNEEQRNLWSKYLAALKANPDLTHAPCDGVTVMWYKNGLANRDYGRPARIRPGGVLEWFNNGELYREENRAEFFIVSLCRRVFTGKWLPDYR